MNFTKYFLCAIFMVGFHCNGSNNTIKESKTSLKGATGISNDAKKPLSYFNIYRGNTHSHTIFTWTHGEHRKVSIDKLSAPTPFHPEWNVPEGVDWKDHNTINLNPESYTNLQGLPENHFELAIANGYDFYAITDHSHEPAMQPISANSLARRATLKAIEKYNKRPGFVALPGFEYSRNTEADGGSGHINVINSSEYISADFGQRGPAPAWPEANWSLPQFYSWVKSAKPYANKGSVVVGFNHPADNQYNNWDHIDKDIVELVSTFEIHTNYKKSRWDAYLKALNKGWKVSPIGVHDNHGYSQITNKQLPPPTFVLAHELTLEAITMAMRERRTFASWNEGVELRYSVNGSIMGSTLDKPEKLNFNIEIKTPQSKPNERVRCIQVLSNGRDGKEDVDVIDEMVFDGKSDEIVWKPVVNDSKAKYVLLRVYHANDMKSDGSFKTNSSTISAPVWTGR